jgi:hypothetical protein
MLRNEGCEGNDFQQDLMILKVVRLKKRWESPAREEGQF